MRKALVLSGWLLAILAGPVVFLAVERGVGVSGFPLDDAWIHQTYARSLAAGRGWVYSGDSVSMGSTSPLWTMLQVPAFWIGLPPVAWSRVLGCVFLLANAAWIALWVRRVDRGASRLAFLFGIAEWHLVWAALSGMETILFCGWISAAVYFFFPLDADVRWKDSSSPRVFLVGLLAGLGIWIRPEALLLSALILPAAFLWGKPLPARKGAALAAGFALPIIAYFAFEWGMHGRLLPNTYYVKTAEYSILTSGSIFLRLLQPLPVLLAGSGIILALFLPPAAGALFRNRNVLAALPGLWAIGHLTLYAVQLPAAYQHGRYFLPILPVLIGYAAYGFSALGKTLAPTPAARILRRTLAASAVGLAAAFLWTGARQFARDVQTIDEMVVLSKWIRDHTPSDALVAAHDIGALGFWGERRLVDLGGVTDLSALPLLRKTVGLREFLSQADADLLMTMPVFYWEELESCPSVPGSPTARLPEDPRNRTTLYDRRSRCGW
jgi:hypothetical protein